MAIDTEKLVEFAEALKGEAEGVGGWNWEAVEGIASLAAKAIGFSGEELADLMGDTPDGKTHILDRHPIRIQFTGGGDTFPPRPGAFTPPKEVHDEAGDEIALAPDNGLDEGSVLILRGAMLFTATHLYNDDNADVEDMQQAWELVRQGLDIAAPGSRPIP